MKILTLRFKNLNSLYGEWAIDFTAPEYASDGIFALTGPTGAGKSTILDAICLALYGTTPRLGKISKSGNDIMSRQTGECYAEVSFESQAGTFRCHWSQHRARKKADGNLADSKHEISDVISQKIIASKKREVLAAIEAKTGMDFERFTRSILLAQGGFDTFLKADVEQKSKILEQITGTEIYTKISKRVHEKQRDEHDTLSLLQAETAGITLLTAEQETHIQQTLDEQKRTEIHTQTQRQEIQAALAWLTNLQRLQAEIRALVVDAESAEQALTHFEPNRARLHQAQKAAELDGRYATLSAARQQQKTDQTAHTLTQAELPEITLIAATHSDQLSQTEAATQALKNEQKVLAPQLQNARQLDQQIADNQGAINTAHMDCQRVTELITQAQKRLHNIAKEQAQQQRTMVQVEEYLQANAQDVCLVMDFAGIKQQLHNVQQAQQSITEHTATVHKATQQVQTAEKTLKQQNQACTHKKQQHTAAQQHITDEKTRLNTHLNGRLLREYRAEKEALLREVPLLYTIAKLESERGRLHDEQACPLCGATEHPYAMGNVPAVSATENAIQVLNTQIDTAEQIEVQIQALEKAEQKISTDVIRSEQLATQAIHTHTQAQQTLQDSNTQLAKYTAQFEQQKQAALLALQPTGITDMPTRDIDALITALQTRLTHWQAHTHQKDTFEKHSHTLNSEQQAQVAIIHTHEQSLREKQAVFSGLKKAGEEKQVSRHAVFGDKNPDEVEKQLAQTLIQAEKQEKQARDQRDKTNTRLNTLTVRIATLATRISTQSLECQTLETDFVDALNRTGFAEESQFQAHRLSVAERQQLTTQANALDQAKTAIHAKQKDRQARLALEQDKQVTPSTLLELEPIHAELNTTLTQIRQSIAQLEHQLTDDIAAKAKIQEKQSRIDAQQTECTHWDKLHHLIGSSDGKKYRNFAQGITFELMVSQANKQLEKMTDRYLLIRDEAQPLALNVVDNYQAGEIRSTKNLSGGESFIVSLTLALGLSKMASHKVRVDSLFLDEGFGTLDENALETALDTLSSLQQEGKLIGVISHVSALKERIGTQISIHPIAGGKSRMTGPGCQNLTPQP